MRLALSLTLFLTLSAHAADKWQDLPNTEVKTGQGLLVVERDFKNFTYTVTLGGRTIQGFDQDSSDASFSNLIHVGAHELVVVAQHSGGIACPTTYVVLQLSAPPRLSKPFGNCNPALKIVPGPRSLKILMPRYAAHTDILSAAEQRQLSKVDVYVWSNGLVKSIGVAQ